jgi:hypothetical protein
MTTAKTGTALALLLLLALAGCGPDETGSASGTPSADPTSPAPAASASPSAPVEQATPTPPAPAATPGRPSVAPKPAPTNVRLVVTRSGGFAGRQDTVTVEPDGRWSRAERGAATRTGRLTNAQRAKLRALLADRKLAGESGTWLSTRCRDSFIYAVSAGPVKTTYADCPSDGTVPPVSGAIAALVLDATG